MLHSQGKKKKKKSKLDILIMYSELGRTPDKDLTLSYLLLRKHTHLFRSAVTFKREESRLRPCHRIFMKIKKIINVNLGKCKSLHTEVSLSYLTDANEELQRSIDSMGMHSIVRRQDVILQDHSRYLCFRLSPSSPATKPSFSFLFFGFKSVSPLVPSYSTSLPPKAPLQRQVKLPNKR